MFHSEPATAAAESKNSKTTRANSGEERLNMFFFIMLDAFSPTHSLIVVVDCCGLSNRSREVTLLLSSLMLLLDFERRAVLARCCMNCQKYDNFRSEQFVAKYRESLKGGPRLCENEVRELRSPACSR